MAGTSSASPPGSGRSLAARLIPSFFLLGLAGLMTLLIGLARERVAQLPSAETWPKADARIEVAEVEIRFEQEPPFQTRVRYHYDYHRPLGGAVEGVPTRFEGRGLNGAEVDGSDYTDLWLRLRPFSPGSTVPVYVNPERPEESTLELPGVWRKRLPWVPTAFLVLFLGLLVKLWSPRRPSAGREMGRLGASLFFGVFLGAGLLTANFISLPILDQLFRRPDWREVPCTVIAGTVRVSTSTDEGRTSYTYSPDILYRYEVEGQTYLSNRYRTLRVSSSGRSAKEEVVQANPPGHQRTCFYLPERPWESVLEKKLGGFAFFGLFPLPFLLVGFFGLLATWFGKGKKMPSLTRSHPRASRVPSVPSRISPAPAEARGEPEPLDPRDLQPLTLQSARKGTFAVLLFVSLFWNGIVGVFLFQVLRQPLRETWFMLLFLTPFLLVGTALLVSVLYTFLQLFNSRFTLELPRRKFRPGEDLSLSWRMVPAALAPAPRKVEIKLVASRTVTSGSGKNRSTRTTMLREVPVCTADDPYQLEQGQGRCRIPDDLHDATEWKLSLAAEVPGWPDVSDSFDVDIA
jgi:hypothetical protein